MTSALAGGQDPAAAVQALLHDPNGGCDLWVGHEPQLSLLVGMLAFGGSPPLSFALRKGGLCRIDVERTKRGLRGELRWLIPPKLLLKVAKL